MCGFAGKLSLNSLERTSYLDKQFDKAYKRLRSRGPDDKGIWVDNNIYLLHTRLKILDLSKASSQPMYKDNYVICFNGEIYNFKKLKLELTNKGHSFISNGDTEILISAWKEWGVSMLKKLDGMFSFVIWDIKNKSLFLARDRFGKKPLVYCIKDNSIFFASDVKSLACLTEGGSVNTEAIQSLFRFRFIHEPMTIYKNFVKLSPGSFMKFNNYGAKVEDWYYRNLKNEGTQFDGTQQLKYLVNKAVNKRLVSDVPIGIFLSGGIDSAIIMDSVAQHGKKIPTFTVGFKNQKKYYDESITASKIAKYFGFKNKTIYLDQKRVLTRIDQILDANDEPFADSSAIAMHMISYSVKGDIKVALTGDGGDELFGGYSKYASYKWKKLMFFLPKNLKHILVSYLSDNKENSFLNFMRKFKRFLESYDYDTEKMQINFLDQLNNKEYKDLFGSEKKLLSNSLFTGSQNFTELNKVLFRDFRFSLLGDMLVKLDRHSMANSIELRSPFLDKDLVNLSFNIPSKKKIGLLNGKLILRESYKDSFPDWYFKLPKKGFEVPLSNWLKSDLKHLVEESTKSSVLESLSIKNLNIISNWKKEFYNGNKDNSWKLWVLVSYYHWAKSSNII
ncbi:MAG: asparagine synthase (glutamine-hydrolyzing) [Rickettsiales bacterium]|nr:asparagine synthase (glutamine-hydrolyzing) [Rickettsiales bacterium]